MCRLVLILGIVGLLTIRVGFTAPGVDDPGGIARTTALIEAAATTGDQAAVRTALGQFDPWVLADELLARGNLKAAQTLVEAVDVGPDATSLAGYAQRILREPKGMRAHFVDALLTVREGRAPDALAALAVPDGLGEGVLRVRWLSARATVAADRQHWREAAALRREAGEVARRLGWRTRSAEEIRLASIAFHADGDLSSAERAARDVVELRRALTPVPGLHRALIDLAFVVSRTGDHHRAQILLDETLRAAPPVRMRVIALTRRALSRTSLGDFAGAHDDLLEADGLIPPGAGGPDRLEIAGAQADLFRAIGDGERGRRWATRALELAEAEVPSPAPPPTEASRHVTIARSRLGLFDLYDGDVERALTTFAEVREAFLAFGDLRHAARAQQNIGHCHLSRRAWTAARAAAIAAHAESRDAGDFEAELHSVSLRADAERGLHRPAVADQLYRDLIEESARRGLRRLELEARLRRARLLWDLRRHDDVFVEVEGGIGLLAVVYSGLDEGTRLGARAQFADLFRVGVEAAHDRGDDRRFLRYLEAGRAGTLLDAMGNRPLRKTVKIPASLEATHAAALAQLLAISTRFRDAGDDIASLRQLHREHTAAIDRYHDAQRRIVQAYRRSSYVVLPAPETMQDARGALATDEAAVGFVGVGPDLVALVLTPTEVSRIRVGSLTDVQGLLQDPRWSERPVERDDTRKALESLDRVAQVLWRPVAAALPPGIRHVYLSVEPPIDAVPFASFASARGQSLTYIPSLSTLAILRDVLDERGVGVLAVGVSSYDGSIGGPGALLRSRLRPLGNLPEAAIEAMTVGDTGSVLINADATEAAVLRTVESRPRWRAVHFACHGLIDRLNPMLSSIAVTPGEGGDGYLTAAEIAIANIPADLVTLSACDTATGPEIPGEGVVPLIRAFLLAGTPRAVANLWPADDAAARVFMTAFHTQWRANTPLTDCLAAARKATLDVEAYRHPYFWAGWVAWGGRR